MKDFDDLDRILMSEEPLAPSSGFAAAVMDGVREAATEPPPLPFPWARFAAGVIACGISAASGTALIVNTEWSTLADVREIMALMGSLRPVAPEIGYAAAAVLGSVALVLLRRAQRRPPTSSR